MTDLSPESRALLDAARDADDPASGARDRVRAKVAAAIAAGAGVGAESASSAGTVGGSAATGGLAIKLALAILAVATVATGAFFAFRGDSSSGTPAPEPEPVAEPVAEAAPAPVAAPAPAPAPAPVAEAEPEPVRKKPTRKPQAGEVAPTADSLEEERAILARATAALRDGDAGAALEAVAEHAKKFPRGVLVEERSATKVLGLCAAGKVAQGVKARDAFLSRWPRSVHAARVQAACAD